MVFFLVGPALAASAHLLVQVSGMDDACCAGKVAAAIEAVPGVASVTASESDGFACATTSGEVDVDAVRASVTAAGYTVGRIDPVAECPEPAPARTELWADVAGLDVQVISRGEAADLGALAPKGRITLFDFGAPWCAPCFTSAATIKAWIATRPDVSVRAIVLDAPNPVLSFALPAAKQHLQFAEGLPWFVVVDARGRTAYKGGDLDAAFAAIEKRRK
jgi:copper chaperone CopZ